MQSSTIRVLIVHNHPIIRRSLALSLSQSSDVEIVGEAATGEEALALLEQVHPDVILLNLVLPGMGGVRAIREIHDVAPEVRILAASNYKEADCVEEALQAGAIGYILSDVEIDRLLNAIHWAASGRVRPDGTIAWPSDRNRAKLGDNLSEREREVLALLVQGFSNTAIAERLVVAPATVKFHLRNIRSKLGTSHLP